MEHRHRLTLATSLAALVLAGLAGPFAGTGTAAEPSDAPASATSIVYSDLYLKLIALSPAGWVWDPGCALVAVSGRIGVCSGTMTYPIYFYPDGTFGKMPWLADPASPTGWRVEPDPCDALTEADDQLWADYQSDTRPDLTPEQIALYESCWPVGF